MAKLSLGVLGPMGAILSITGIFGMAAYSVSKRLEESGIRVVLGARRKEVLQAALGRAFKLLAIAMAAGLRVDDIARIPLSFPPIPGLWRERHTVPPTRSSRSSAARCTESTNERMRRTSALAEVIGNRVDGQFPENGVCGNFESGLDSKIGQN